MPVTQDIRDAIARNDADEAEALMAVVQSKHNGHGLSGHDQQIFAGQIARIRTLGLTVEPEAEPEPEPEPEAPKAKKASKPKAKAAPKAEAPKPRTASKPARVVKVNTESGDLESA